MAIWFFNHVNHPTIQPFSNTSNMPWGNVVRRIMKKQILDNHPIFLYAVSVS